MTELLEELTAQDEIQAQIVANRTLLKELFAMAHQLAPALVEDNLERKQFTRDQLLNKVQSHAIRVAVRSMEMQIETLEAGIGSSRRMLD